MLPADRQVVWARQSLVRNRDHVAGLTVAAVVMAASSTERWNPQDTLTRLDALGLTVFVLVALGWGLFWSSVQKTALAAAVPAIVCQLALRLAGLRGTSI